MRRALFFSTLLVSLSVGVAAQSQPNTKAPAKTPVATTPASPEIAKTARASFAKLPLSFEENRGQADERVKFLSHAPNYNLFLTADEAVLTLRHASPNARCTSLPVRNDLRCPGGVTSAPSKTATQDAVLWLKMLGANADAQVSGSDVLPGKINYYVGNDPSKWRIGVRQFGRVTYRGIYPGVDMTYYGNQRQLESDFIVAPGANPRAIEFEVKGANETRVDAQENLILATSGGNVQLMRPGIYQTVHGIRHDVSGRYVVRGKNRVGFEIAKYDTRNALIIDPTLVFSTYLGGSEGESGLAIAIDTANPPNVYVTGQGYSTDFPGAATNGPVGVDSPFVFVTKFDPTGNTLLYSTLLRGTTGYTDAGNGIGVDGSGNAYVDGVTTDQDFPLLNPFQATAGNGVADDDNTGFVAGLTSTGTLIYSTYFGGRNDQDITTLQGLYADSVGNAYVIGDTTSYNFPTVNPLYSTSGAAYSGYTNVIVAKFNGQGQPIYSTYLPGNGEDVGNAIVADAAGNAYVTGETSSTNFPMQTSPAPFQAALNNSPEDVFVTKLSFNANSQTLSLAGGTYLGGSSTDEGWGIAVDTTSPPNVYVTGATSSSGTGTSGFPTKSPIYAANAGGSDGFVTKIKGDFTALIYSTYLGGSGNDTAYGIALDGANPPNAYVTGSTASSNFPGVSPLQSTLGSVTATNAFVTEVNGAGSVITYSTYLGGTKSDMGRGIAADASGNAYIVGTATSSNFPVLSSSGVTASPFQGSLGSASGNAFVGKISPAAAASALNFFPPIYNFGEVAVGAGSAATGGFATETVTLSNNTSSSVSITSFSFTGTNAADFTLQAAAAPCLTSGAFAIPAGASCALTIKFAPSAQDTRSAQLTINSSPLSTSALMLSGFGAVPEISITPASMNFSTSAPLNIGSLNDVEITNTGGATLNVGSVQITGANASAFTLTENSCTSVAAGSSCFIEVTFTPTAAQAYNATLLINDNVDGSPQSVPLGGTGVAQVNVSPISIEYRGWIVGVQSSDAEITVTNGSGGSVTLTSIVAGTSTTQSNFHVDANPTSCTNGLVLPAGSSCNMAVYFKPNAGSAIDGLTGSFTFNWNGTVSGQQTVNVMGTGETGVTLYTNSINAFSEYVGVSESESAADIIYNGTTNPVTINSIVLSGANPADWTVNLGFSPTGSDCSADGIVPALSYCYLGGSFSPSALGTRTAIATINYTGASPNTPLVLTLTGTGIPGPVIFPSVVNFGSQIVGLVAPTHRVLLENVSKTPLQISSITPPGGSFAIASTSTCTGTTLVPGGGTCFLDLTFTPSGTGSLTATITETDNGPGSPRTLTLNGTGVTGANTISVSPAVVDFGNVPLVAAGLTQPTLTAAFYLTNGSNAATQITTAAALTTPSGTPFAIVTGASGGTCVLNATVLPTGGTCSVVVGFKPTTVGEVSNSVTLTDSVGGLHTVTIQGEPVDQGVLSISSTTFTQLPGTVSAQQTVTVTNTGTGPLTITSTRLTEGTSPGFALVPAPATTCALGTVLAAAPGPSNTCVIAATFTAPTTTGSYGANLSVAASLGNGVSGSTSTTLEGTVVAGGFSVSPAAPFNFGTAAIGTTVDYAQTFNNYSYITITNNNPGTVTITSIAPQNAGDFTITSGSNTCTSPLAVNNSCSFDITFAPTINGTEPTNNILVSYTGATGSPLTLAVKGAGSNAVVANPNPLSVTVNAGNSASPTVTVANGSTSTINISGTAPVISPSGSPFTFSYNGCSGTQLTATGGFGNTCPIYLNFSGTTGGTFPASFVLNYTVGTNPTVQTLTVNLSGTVTAPAATLSSNTLTFPSQNVNTQSPVMNVVITNTGNGALYFTGTERISGTNANDFALGTQSYNTGCFDVYTVMPGQSCVLPVTFTPSGSGTRGPATLTITDNAGTQTVQLNGSAAAGIVSTETTNLNFPQTNIGSTTTQGVLLSNTTASAITLSSIQFTVPYSIGTGPNACASGTTVGAITGSCVIYITFAPNGGTTSGTAVVKYNNGNTTLPTINLTGTQSSPVVSLGPNPLTFPTVLEGSSNTMTVTLLNGTGSAITINSVPSVSGTNQGDFTPTTTVNGCTNGEQIASGGGSCPVNIKFSPLGVGPRTATFTISYNGGSQSVTLNGTGDAPATITATSGASQSIAVNTAFAPLQATVKDSNGVLLSGVSVSFVVTPAGNGASGTFAGGVTTVQVTTDSNGLATAPTFTANNTPGGPYNVAATVSGVATAANFTLTNLTGTPASITTTSGTPQSVAISTAFASLQTTVKDSNSLPLSGVIVTFNAPSSGPSGTFAGGTNGGLTATATTNSSGIATAPTFTANGTAGGPYNVTAVAGTLSAVNFVLTNLTGAPASITPTAGTPQSIAISTPFTISLQATVKDSGGNLLSGVPVTFTAPTTGASGTFTGGVTTLQVSTNASGVATAAFTANSTVGTYTVNASVSGVGTPAAFSLTNLAGPPASVTATAGTPQSIAISTAFPTALQATVKDSGGNLVSGATVTFTAPSTGAGGTFANGTNVTTATTNASGVATASTFTSNAIPGAYSVTATSGTASSGTFSLTNLTGPPATITATAGASQSAAVTTAFATLLQATVKDSGGNLVPNATVTFTAPASGASGTFANGTNTTNATTNASGVATATAFTANTIAGGPYNVTASSGAATTATFSLTNNPGPAAVVTATGGASQSAAITTAFGTLLQATVKDANGNLVSGATVTFTAPSTGASGTFANGTATTSATTNASGVATATAFTANTVAGGPYNVTATSGTATAANFALTNTAGPAAAITATAGTPQSIAIGTAFPTALQATVKDSHGNLVSGATVTFTAPSTGASGTFANGTNTTTATTNASGVATASTFTANTVAGGPYSVTATSGTATSATFSLTNQTGPPAAITATSGGTQSVAVNAAFAAFQATVKDSGGNTLSGVVVTFTVTPAAGGASGTFTGGLTTATATTNASGVATAPTFTANTIPGGPYTVTATTGTATSAVFTLTNLTEPPASIAATAGTPQSAVIGAAFTTAFQATVLDTGSHPIDGVTVTFTAPSTGPSGTFANGTTTTTATTNASGVATASAFTANSIAGGPYNVAATASGVGPANFSLTNQVGPPATITATSGATQSVVINTAFAALQVTVKDSGGNLVSGASVTFTAPSSGASGTFAAPGSGATATVTTNASGVAIAPTFTANSVAGGPYTVKATSGSATAASFTLTNQPGPPSVIVATGGASQSVAVNTAFAPMQVTVKDNSGNVISGVNVTFAAPSTGASGTFTGGGTTAAVATNASGVATAPTFTANNTVGGPYNVTATAMGLPVVDFVLTNLAGVPASITATGGTPQSVAINLAFASLQATVKDSNSLPLSGVIVTFTAPSSGPSGTFAGGTNGGLTATATTNTNGVATAPAFTANSTAGGPYNVTAVAGTLSAVNFALTNLSGPPASVTATAGTPQSIAIGTAFPTSLQATVKDSGGNLLSGVIVTFTAPSTGASGTFTGGATTLPVTTNASGVASAPFTANSTVGTYTVNATVSGVTATAAFSLTNLSGPPAAITPTAGTPQSIVISTAFPTALQATVKDSGSNPVSGASVTFTAPSTGASGTFAAPGAGATATVTTNASGVATSPIFTANGTAGAYSVTATVTGVMIGATFSLTNLAGPPASIAATAGTPQSVPVTTAFPTALQATVKDSGGNLVSGATVIFTAPSTGASGTFAGGTNGGLTATATTNASGVATAPAFTANAVGGSYNVTASVTGVTATAAFALTNTVAPDVSISISPTATFTVGTNGTYTVNLVNNGTGSTTGTITVMDTLPTGLIFVSGAGTGWTCNAAAQVVTCTNATVGALTAKGGTSTVTLTVSVGPNAISSATSFSVTDSATVADPNDTTDMADKTAPAITTNINNAIPTLSSSFSPALGLIAGATTDQTITLNGTGFNASTTVSFNGVVLTGGTANAAGTSLTITVPHADLATVPANGTVIVFVTNPKNPTTNVGGGPSTNQTFPVVGFSLALQTGTPNPVPLVAGTPVTFQVNVPISPTGAALPASVTIACTVPAALTGATCTPGTTTIAQGSTTASTMITLTAVPGGSSRVPPSSDGPGPLGMHLMWLAAMVFAAMWGMFLLSRQRALQVRRTPMYLTLFLLAIGAATLIGCTTSPMGPTPTPTGASTVTVTATTADGASSSIQVPINVTN